MTAWACSTFVSGITSANSSPPTRNARSPRRTYVAMVVAACRRTWSPAAWPLESLIRLKSSRSMIASDIERPAARRDRPLPLDLLLEGPVVAEAGEGVAERLGAGAVVGVLEDPARLLEALGGLEHAAREPDRQGTEHDGEGQDRDRRDDERRAHPGRQSVDERRRDHDRDREHRDEREEQAKTDEPKVRRFAEERVRTPRCVADEQCPPGSGTFVISGGARKWHARVVPNALGPTGAAPRHRWARGPPAGSGWYAVGPSEQTPSPRTREPRPDDRTAHHRLEDLGRPRRHAGPGRPGRPRRRPPPRPRGHQPAGVHRAPQARPPRPPSGPDRRDRRPLDPDHPARPADPRRDGRRPGPPARGQLRRVRHPAPRHRLAEPGHRPRHRAAAGPDPARA